MYDVMQLVGPIRSSPKENGVPNIHDIYHQKSGLTRQPYTIVVSVPAENHNMHAIYHHLSPSGTHAFNVA
jgi:hypothetical protein